MPIAPPIPVSLTDKEARKLSRQIVTDSNTVIVKFGQTNGRRVLHVNDTKAGRSFTVSSAADWDDCPLNNRSRRKRREEVDVAIDGLVTANER